MYNAYNRKTRWYTYGKFCTICTNFLNLKLFQNFYFIRSITELFSVFVIYPKFTVGPAYEHYGACVWGVWKGSLHASVDFCCLFLAVRLVVGEGSFSVFLLLPQS